MTPLHNVIAKEHRRLKQSQPPMHRSAVMPRKPLRENVVAFIINRQNAVLLMKRSRATNHWQLPQGGVNKGETKYAAVLRESREEVGLERLKLIGVVQGFHTYEWPKHFEHAIEPYRGQRQTIYFLRHLGRDNDVRVDRREASAYAWVAFEKLVATIAPVRRSMARKAVALYADLFMMKHAP